MGSKYTKKQREAFAAQQRANPTATERLMWEYIRDDQCGATFERQVVTPCGWIADFLCESRKLIIELDGVRHTETYREDKKRDEAHAMVGYYTIRIQSEDVMNESSAYFKGHISWAIRNHELLRGELPPEFDVLPVLDGYRLLVDVNAFGVSDYEGLDISRDAAMNDVTNIMDQWTAANDRIEAERLKFTEAAKTIDSLKCILRKVLEA